MDDEHLRLLQRISTQLSTISSALILLVIVAAFAVLADVLNLY